MISLREIGSRVADAAVGEVKSLAHDAAQMLGLEPSAPYYPPPAFNFSVRIIGSGTLLSALTSIDASFQEISGVSVHWRTEEVAEGGENRFVHRLPVRPQYSNLVMKRGVVTKSSFFNEWSTQSLGAKLNGPVIPQNVLVSLNGTGSVPLVCWYFVRAFPVRIETSAMNSQANEALIDTVELSYAYFERFTPHSLASVAVTLARLVV